MRILLVLAVLLSAGLLVARPDIVQAQQEKSAEGPKAMPMFKPMPPAELKTLEPLVGKWAEQYEYTAEMIPPQGCKGSGETTCQWVLDGWFLKSELSTDPSEGGCHKAVDYKWYDPQSKTYRTWGINNFGQVQQGEGSYDAPTKTWTFHYQGLFMGRPANSRMTLRLATPDKVEWDWHTRFEGEDDFKLMMKGTSTRAKE